MKVTNRYPKKPPTLKDFNLLLLNSLKLSQQMEKALGNHGYELSIYADSVDVGHITDMSLMFGMGGNPDDQMKTQFIDSMTKDWLEHWKFISRS